MELTANEICEWIDSQIGKSMTIQKREQQDMDVIEFILDDVSLMRSSDTLDDYIWPESIVLRGDGTIPSYFNNINGLK